MEMEVTTVGCQTTRRDTTVNARTGSVFEERVERVYEVVVQVVDVVSRTSCGPGRRRQTTWNRNRAATRISTLDATAGLVYQVRDEVVSRIVLLVLNVVSRSDLRVWTLPASRSQHSLSGYVTPVPTRRF